MVGWLKVSSVIAQCKRCFSLRNVKEEPKYCPTCLSLLNEHVTAIRWLSFGDVSDDVRSSNIFVMTTVDAMHGAGTVQ
jgi:hypothetical protein